MTYSVSESEGFVFTLPVKTGEGAGDVPITSTWIGDTPVNLRFAVYAPASLNTWDGVGGDYIDLGVFSKLEHSTADVGGNGPLTVTSGLFETVIAATSSAKYIEGLISYALHGGNISDGGYVYGLESYGDVSGAGVVVTDAVGLCGQADVTAGAVTTNLVGLEALITSSGAGSTATNGYGVKVRAPATSASGVITTKRGVQIEAQGTGTNDANLYSEGTDGRNVIEGYIELFEKTDAAAPVANRVRLYSKDNGSGKTQVVARFPTGAVQVIATEP